MNIRSFDSFLAHPTNTAGLENATIGLALQVSQECKDIDHCRTLQNIIYTCLSTIFLCTWVVLHLNVPRYPKNTTPLRRVWFMLGALIVPEAIFIVAFNDWLRGSVMLERVLDCGWTEVHIQFAQMGGFQLILDDGTPNPLHGDDFVNHVLNGTIDVPRISAEEILDRSKSDSIAKGIVVIQTAWFVLQCIHRVVARLTITELEITTLGHAITNFIIYWCWWNKPKDVGLAIDIVCKSNIAMPPEKASRERSSNHATERRILLGASNAQTLPGTDEGPARNSFPRVSDKETNLCPDDSLTLRATPSFVDPSSVSGEQAIAEDSALGDPISACGPLKEPSICQMDPILDNGGTKIDRPIPPTPCDTNVDAHHDNKGDANVKHDTEALKKLPIPPFTLRVRLGILLENFTVQSTVPTRTVCITILFMVASVFGAIHCAAWNAHFPTSLERIIWRFAAAFVTVTGGCLNIVINIRHVDVEERDIAFVRGSTAAAEFPLIVLYCSARLSLLVLALLALRALPYDAFVSPPWTSFIPHVS